MKEINYGKFEENISDVINSVIGAGDVFLVKREAGGDFVIMDKSEYDILLEALRMTFAAAASVNPDEKTISIEKTLKRFEEQWN